MRLIDADELIECFERLDDEDAAATLRPAHVIEVIDAVPTVELYKHLDDRNRPKLRPCIAEGKKAMFHRWSAHSKIVEPSPLIGGHNGGVMQWTVGIIEFEDGQIAEVLPYNIKFSNDI